ASDDLVFLDALGADDVQVLNLRDTNVNDEGLAHVGRLTGLRLLDLQSVRITDAGVRQLTALKQLQHIDLEAFSVNRDGSGVGDAALRALALGGLTDLRPITLRLKKVRDEGMAALALHKSRETIQFPGTAVTDAGLAHLKRLPRLDTLWLGVYEDGA